MKGTVAILNILSVVATALLPLVFGQQDPIVWNKNECKQVRMIVLYSGMYYQEHDGIF